MKNKSLEQQKYEFLIKRGWEQVKPEFDLEHFVKLAPQKVLSELGSFVSNFSRESSNNPFAIFGEEVRDHQEDFMSSICPAFSIPPAPTNCAMINSQWPIEDNGDTSENAFSELTYRTIVLIVEKALGVPINIFQETNEKVFKYTDPSSFNFDKLELVGTLTAVWDDAYLEVHMSSIWTSTGTINSLDWRLYSPNLRTYSAECLGGVGLEINPSTYQLGNIDPEFNLNSFPEYIRNHTYNLEVEMGFKKGAALLKNYPERFNILVEGPPGYGKTRWSHAFASEVLSRLGYLIIVVDYSSLETLVLPSYLDKVCIIINDADNLCLDRETSTRGETEQMLAWLDGTRSTFIKPFYMARRTSTITIITANTVERWDEAALRKGRIHSHKMFNEVQLSDA